MKALEETVDEVAALPSMGAMANVALAAQKFKKGRRFSVSVEKGGAELEVALAVEEPEGDGGVLTLLVGPLYITTLRERK